MATIYLRKDIEPIRYRVQIRRLGIKSFSISFRSLEEAEEWVRQNEYKYINDPTNYLEWIRKERLRIRRQYEFQDKGHI